MKRRLICLVIIALAAALLSACAESGPSLKLSKMTVGKGEPIQVKWTAPGTYAKDAWVGIVPAEIPHGSEAENDKHDLSYQYMKGNTSGTFQFPAPNRKGKYDFRMHDADGNGQEVASVSFSVG